MSDRRAALERFIWAALPALLVLVLYLPTLGHGLITDDRPLIIENPYLQSWEGLRGLVTKDLWAASGAEQSTQYYRPLPMVTLWLQVMSFGSSPAWLRLGNLMLLASSSLVLVALLRRQWPSLGEKAAVLIACAWAAHPLNTEATIWLSGRFDLCLILGTLSILTLNLTASRTWSVPLAFALTLLSKEPAVVVLPVLLVQDRFAGHALRTEVRKAIALVLVIAAYLVIRHQVGVISAQALQSASPSVLLQSYATLLAMFGRLLVIPLGLDVHHWYVPICWPIAGGLLALAAIAGLFALWRAWRDPNSSGLAVGLALCAVSLAPVALIGPNQHIYGDRFASLFVAGLAVASPALTGAMSRVLLKSKWLVAVAWVGVWSLFTLFRGSEWQSEQRLMDSALAEDATNPHWQVLRAHQLLAEDRPNEVVALLSGVSRLHPEYYKIWNALCVGYLRTEQQALAQRACQNGMTLDPKSPVVWLNWGYVQLGAQRWEEALQAGMTALGFRARYAGAEYVVGAALAQLGRLDEARAHVERGLAIDPSYSGLDDLKRQLDQRAPR